MRVFFHDALPLQHAAVKPAGITTMIALIAAAAGRIGGRAARAMERSRQRRALALLSDHQLADIGLTREQIMAESASSVWQEEPMPATELPKVLVDDLRQAA
jgi:uncharacterized protein YjiS (DUF1127 family)